jgi:hypothetical protein
MVHRDCPGDNFVKIARDVLGALHVQVWQLLQLPAVARLAATGMVAMVSLMTGWNLNPEGSGAVAG